MHVNHGGSGPQVKMHFAVPRRRPPGALSPGGGRHGHGGVRASTVRIALLIFMAGLAGLLLLLPTVFLRRSSSSAGAAAGVDLDLMDGGADPRVRRLGHHRHRLGGDGSLHEIAAAAGGAGGGGGGHRLDLERVSYGQDLDLQQQQQQQQGGSSSSDGSSSGSSGGGAKELAARSLIGGSSSSLIGDSSSSGSGSSGKNSGSSKERVAPLAHPVWWAGPFRSGSGYGSEAISYAMGVVEEGLIRPQDMWTSHSGDIYLKDFERKMEKQVVDFLNRQDWGRLAKDLPPHELNRKAMVVCHSFPDCWLSPHEKSYPGLPGCPCPTKDMEGRYAYKIGRTMFETASLPSHLAEHVKQFDEVWVPSDFNRESFAKAGVDPAKIFIVPQGINTTLFDPARHAPFSLKDFGAELCVGTEPGKADKKKQGLVPKPEFDSSESKPGFGSGLSNFGDLEEFDLGGGELGGEFGSDEQQVWEEKDYKQETFMDSESAFLDGQEREALQQQRRANVPIGDGSGSGRMSGSDSEPGLEEEDVDRSGSRADVEDGLRDDLRDGTTDQDGSSSGSSKGDPLEDVDIMTDVEDGDAHEQEMKMEGRALASLDDRDSRASSADSESTYARRRRLLGFAGEDAGSGSGSEVVDPAGSSGPRRKLLRSHFRGLSSGSSRSDGGGSSSGSSKGKKREKPFVFLSIFKWEGRKGWELLLRAYLEEFSADENTELHIVTHPFMETVSSWTNKIRDGIKARCHMKEAPGIWEALPRVYVTSKYVPDDLYPRIYKFADALVIPTRGEGWGRPQMEAMAMGLPVISTNWSGLTAFMTEEASYPIRIDGLTPAVSDGPSFFGYFSGQQWANPSLAHLRQLMRRVYDNEEEAHAKGSAARRWILQEFSPRAVAEKLAQQIRRVDKKLRQQDEERAVAATAKMAQRLRGGGMALGGLTSDAQMQQEAVSHVEHWESSGGHGRRGGRLSHKKGAGLHGGFKAARSLLSEDDSGRGSTAQLDHGELQQQRQQQQSEDRLDLEEILTEDQVWIQEQAEIHDDQQGGSGSGSREGSGEGHQQQQGGNEW